MSKALNTQLADLLHDELQRLMRKGDTASKELRDFADTIADEVVAYALKDPGDERGNLKHLLAQSRMIAGIMALDLSDEAWERAISLLAKGLRIALASISD